LQILTESELIELESTLLPSLERHHLRLLAHGLRTLQAISSNHRGGPPDHSAITSWAAGQSEIADDPRFLEAFVEQLLNVAHQLDVIARETGRQPMALELSDLVAWSRRLADDRIVHDRLAEASLSPREGAGSPPPG
jgi:hypothetical protein